MIIFGTRGVTSTAETGRFFCPQCQHETDYKHKRVRKFFTLYFIPLIPLNLEGEYIECTECDGTFKLGVLDMDPQADMAEFQAEFHHAVKRVMVEMMLADGTVEEQELDVIRNIYQQLVGSELSDEDVRKEIVEAETRAGDVTESLKELSAHLNDQGKELVVRAAFMVAAADNEFQDEEKALIGSIGQALQMTPAHLNGVIADMMQPDDA